MPPITKPEIIATAACPVCCAPRGTPCTFIRADDPHGRRMAAMQSHLPRMIRARERASAAKKFEADLLKELASLPITV